MTFDAGNFFTNLFNNIGKITETSANSGKKTENQNANTYETKYLPDEAQDENISTSKDMLMYGIPRENIAMYAVPKPEPTEEYTEVKYGIPNPEPTFEDVARYAVPKPEPTEEYTEVKYGIPNPEPAPTEIVSLYAVPSPEPTSEPIDVVKYGVPEPTVTPSPTTSPTPSNPWRTNLSNLFTRIFNTGTSSFMQRMNNFFKNLFSFWR
ncbi:hypothetical protein IJS77_04475 [bacterium]|nr:hypothetical protein [bacterium]